MITVPKHNNIEYVYNDIDIHNDRRERKGGAVSRSDVEAPAPK